MDKWRCLRIHALPLYLDLRQCFRIHDGSFGRSGWLRLLLLCAHERSHARRSVPARIRWIGVCINRKYHLNDHLPLPYVRRHDGHT